MKVSATLFISTLAAIANAISLTNSNYNIQEGQPFDIKWSGAVGAVTIVLKNGNSGDLKTVTTIASNVSGDEFSWTPSGLASDTYAIEVIDSSGNSNYSPQWSYLGTGTPSVTASTASSTATSASTVTSSTSTQSTSITTAANSTTTLAPISNSTTLTTSTSTSSSGSSSTASTTSSSASATGTKVPTTNDGHRVASSLALILGAVAAFAAFN